MNCKWPTFQKTSCDRGRLGQGYEVKKFTGSLLLGDKFKATNSVILTAVLAKSHRTTTKVYG